MPKRTAASNLNYGPDAPARASNLSDEAPLARGDPGAGAGWADPWASRSVRRATGSCRCRYPPQTESGDAPARMEAVKCRLDDRIVWPQGLHDHRCDARRGERPGQDGGTVRPLARPPGRRVHMFSEAVRSSGCAKSSDVPALPFVSRPGCRSVRCGSRPFPARSSSQHSRNGRDFGPVPRRVGRVGDRRRSGLVLAQRCVNWPNHIARSGDAVRQVEADDLHRTVARVERGAVCCYDDPEVEPDGAAARAEAHPEPQALARVPTSHAEPQY